MSDVIVITSYSIHYTKLYEPHDAVARVVHADLVERHLVARVMHDTGGDRYPVGKAHGRQVAGNEFRAASYNFV